MPQITKSKGQAKANHQKAKPYDGFPLTAHPSGRWCKKHKGQQHYFGPVDDWEKALERYKHDWPYILKGETPPAMDSPDANEDGCTFQRLCNEFLNAKRRKAEAGELSLRSIRDYGRTTDRLIAHFGKHRRIDKLRPSDFDAFRQKLAAKFGPVSLKNEINRCRVVFKFAHDQRLIEQPVNYGQSFDRPSAKMLRKARNEAGPKLFEAREIRAIFDALDGKPFETGEVAEDGQPETVTLKRDVALRAMVLLGCNCGFGNSDIANLPQSAVDLENGWIEFPRPKTEIPRRIPLWPDTIGALRQALAERPQPLSRDDGGLVFLTRTGQRWVRMQRSRKDPNKFVPIDPLGQKFLRLLKRLKINGRRGLGFYTLRHVFQTIGGNAKDPDAVASIMGHVDSSMGAVYRERIDDARLRDVVNVVRAWLWPAKERSVTEDSADT